MLSVLALRSGMRQMRIVDADLLLEVLEGIVWPLGQSLEPGVLHMICRDMAAGQKRGRGKGMVR